MKQFLFFCTFTYLKHLITSTGKKNETNFLLIFYIYSFTRLNNSNATNPPKISVRTYRIN